ncbi:ribosome biogenesis protein BOP1 isoform X2 [Lathamus discolor]|uniref:ribosome biogenesis protein BOP1 isoform X2 n=1 Tax=Lathamus discolor TaxID=678569 RepID=UPI0032B8462B
MTADPSPVTADPSPSPSASIPSSQHPMTADPSPVTADPSPMTADPSPMTADPSPVTTDPSPMTADPSPSLGAHCPLLTAPSDRRPIPNDRRPIPSDRRPISITQCFYPLLTAPNDRRPIPVTQCFYPLLTAPNDRRPIPVTQCFYPLLTAPNDRRPIPSDRRPIPNDRRPIPNDRRPISITLRSLSGLPPPGSHQLPLVAEAESADLLGLGGIGVPARGAAGTVVVEGRRGEAGLAVAARLAQQEHVAQVRDVTGGQAQGLDLGELPVGRLGGDEGAQRREGRVNAVGAVPFPSVRRVALPRLPVQPSRFLAVPALGGGEAVAVGAQAVGLLLRARALAAVLLVLRQHDLGVQETDIRNTVGNIPMEWYQDFPHIGYDLEGKKIYKPIRNKDELDLFLDKMENPDYWRTVQDKMTGADVKLTDEQIALVQRLQKGHFGDVHFNPYEPAVDFFTHEVMLHPVSNRPADKRSFIPSLIEKEKVSKLVHAIKMGWIKPRKPKDDAPTYYDLWAHEDPNSILGRHKMHVPAPKMKLPGHEESYNPPPEYLLSEEERLAWQQQEPAERRLSFVPRQHRSLRAVPAFPRFIHERFERCLDLYLCPRQRKMRVNVDPEDLIPKLPKPRDLQPFPTTQALVYRGHTSLVRCLSISPSGQWLVSGSDDGSARFWEVSTARCLRTLPVGGVVKSLAWNPNPSICLVAIGVEQSVLLVNPCLGDKLLYGATDQLLASFVPPEEERVQPVQWVTATAEEHSRGIRLLIQHSKAVKQVTWHGKGDYFASVVSDNSNLQVLIHQCSKRWSQNPFRRSKGLVQCVLFHPVRPYFFVATQRYVRVYNLLKQELTKKLMSNCKWVSSMAIHPGGDNIICGSYDSKLAWFDLDLSTRPYQVLRHHKRALRSVAFHKRYPLFASASDDGTVIVCHGMVYNDLLQNPLLVPVKVLKGHALTLDLGVLDVLFHPTQPWVFSSGADGTVRLYT